MKNTAAILMLAAVLFAGCSSDHFISDRTFRNTVEKDYSERMEATSGVFAPFAESSDALVSGEQISSLEKGALTFLYAYMPLADMTDYPASFYLENVRASFRAREELGWNVPEREFRHFVLPLRVNNESLDSARTVFYAELAPRVKGLSMEEAVLEVNHWCHEKVTYQPSDGRTSSPLNLVRNALGRCGEESTFCVTALRSVGIPARQVYTPRWAHTDDNHAWVEAWADGQWHFIGACEPEPVLDLGWFSAPASRALLMHTKVFGKYDGPEEVVLESPNFTEVNLIDNYAETARVDFRVVWSDVASEGLAGTPVEGARVDFCIYNYAEFYSAVSKYTDAQGRTFSGAGLGDMLVWASKDGNFGYSRVSFGKDKEVEIVLSYGPAIPGSTPVGVRESFLLVPPAENYTTPPVTDVQRAENDRRAVYEDSLRHAYEATFPKGDPARGNWQLLSEFRAKEDAGRVEKVLSSLSRKDFHDVTRENLEDYYNAPVFLGSRVENEFLTPFYSYFRDNLPESFASAAEVADWVRANITVIDDPKAWNIPMSPAGVEKLRMAYPRSRDIFFVTLARAKGFEARKDPVTGKVQYKEGGSWLDVDFSGGASQAKQAPKGTLALAYKPAGSIVNPGYYTHFSISKISGGRPRLMAFDEGEVDMGGGMDWANIVKGGLSLDEGTYLLVSGNRLADGSVPVSMQFFSISEGKVTDAELVIEVPGGPAKVYGKADSAFAFTLGEAETSVGAVTGGGSYVLAVLEPGREPTNHALRDLSAAREKLEEWGRPVILLCKTPEALAQLRKETSDGRYGTLPSTVVLGLDTKDVHAAISSVLGMSGRLPAVVLVDAASDVRFRSEGYTIGLGEQLCDVAAKL